MKLKSVVVNKPVASLMSWLKRLKPTAWQNIINMAFSAIKTYIKSEKRKTHLKYIYNSNIKNIDHKPNFF